MKESGREKHEQVAVEASEEGSSKRDSDADSCSCK